MSSSIKNEKRSGIELHAEYANQGGRQLGTSAENVVCVPTPTRAKKNAKKSDKKAFNTATKSKENGELKPTRAERNPEET